MEFTTNLWDALSSNPTLDNDLLNKIYSYSRSNHKMTKQEFLLDVPHKNQRSYGIITLHDSLFQSICGFKGFDA